MSLHQVPAAPSLVLLVEDNPDHAELIRRSLSGHHIHHVADGEAALDYLFRRGMYADPARSPRPQLVLLDLRLPRIDGFEVLSTIKTTESTLDIPVIILTTSGAQKDVARAYAHHANSYLVKPVDFDQLSELMGLLGRYWLGWNCLPE